MARLAKQFKPLNLTVAVLLLFMAVGGFLWRSQQLSKDLLGVTRPSDPTTLVFDYARLLSENEPSLNRALKSLNEAHELETIIVTVENIPDELTMESLARRLMENWAIGQTKNGRGILILVGLESRQVRLNFTTGLAEFYSDRFRRHIEIWPWQNYFQKNDISTGISSVLAHIETRARLIEKSGATPADIQRYDDQLKSASTVVPAKKASGKSIPSVSPAEQ